MGEVMKRYVLARSFRQYRDWLDRNHVRMRDAVYVSSPEMLDGLRLKSEQLVTLDGSDGHPQAERIRRAVLNRLDRE